MNAAHVRETPVPEPLRPIANDPVFPDVGPNVGDLKEPVLEIKKIQGSILPGFNKDHRMLVFLTIIGGEEVNFKCWLKTQINFIATAEEVLSFNRLFKFTKVRRGGEGTIKSTWTNVAFSFPGLQKLAGVTADDFTDKSFTKGVDVQSASLGDPTDPSSSGAAVNWLIGGPDNRADVLFMVEADDRNDMLSEVSRIENSMVSYKKSKQLKTDFADIIFKDEGANLPPPLSGHEHFGFLDGVSQPGIRGRISDEPNDVLTIRQNPLKRDQQLGKGKREPAQGKPGQDLLWPGEFVFGYQRQDPSAENISIPRDADNAGPEWIKNGSFLVFRRLRQDVGAFHQFLNDTAKKLNIPHPANSSAARLVGAKLVGRWPSGAPVERQPDIEDPKLADDDCANNNFEFQGASDAIAEVKSGNPNNPTSKLYCIDNTFERSDQPNPDSDEGGDGQGSRCPFTGHIRKSYPRDDVSNNPGGDKDKDACNDSRKVLGEEDTQTHRLLRRGLPYGPVSRSTPETPFNDNIDRGLQFLAYQTSIENQFEFVTNCWVNNPDFKEPNGTIPLNTPVEPKLQGGGYDPIIGQNPNNGRVREFTITIPDPDPLNARNKSTAVRISTADSPKKDWVIPTGGGYFFTPSMDALENVLSLCDDTKQESLENPEGAGQSQSAVTPAAS